MSIVLLLSGCRKDDIIAEQQKKIDEQEQKINYMVSLVGSETDKTEELRGELNNKNVRFRSEIVDLESIIKEEHLSDSLLLDLYSNALSHQSKNRIELETSKDSIKTDIIKRQVQRFAKFMMKSKYTEIPIWVELLGLSNESAIDSLISAGNSYTILERIRYAKGGNGAGFADATTSHNHKYGMSQYIFEYLGDCIGLNMWGTPVLLELFGTPEELAIIINMTASKVFSIFEKEWSAPGERKRLIEALDFVLLTTEKVDYDAELILNDDYVSTFANKVYERRWNGIQKFFFRLENNYPGSAELVREQIRLYVEGVKDDITFSL